MKKFTDRSHDKQFAAEAQAARFAVAFATGAQAYSRISESGDGNARWVGTTRVISGGHLPMIRLAGPIMMYLNENGDATIIDCLQHVVGQRPSHDVHGDDLSIAVDARLNEAATIMEIIVEREDVYQRAREQLMTGEEISTDNASATGLSSVLANC